MARTFNGTNQTLTGTGSSVMQVAAPITWQMWVKGSSPGNFRYYISKLRLAGEHVSWGFATGGSAELLAYIGWGGSAGNVTNGNTGMAAAGVFNGSWHHVLATYNQTLIRTFMDGAEMGGGVSETRAISYSSNNLYIGSFDGTQLWVPADIAEVAVWNVALTQPEITALAKGMSPLGVRPASTVMYWPLWGRHSPEPDLRARQTLAVTGATAGTHPAIKRPSGLYVPVKAGSTPPPATQGVWGIPVA